VRTKIADICRIFDLLVCDGIYLLLKKKSLKNRVYEKVFESIGHRPCPDFCCHPDFAVFL
jgi:hypothetical protein